MLSYKGLMQIDRAGCFNLQCSVNMSSVYMQYITIRDSYREGGGALGYPPPPKLHITYQGLPHIIASHLYSVAGAAAHNN